MTPIRERIMKGRASCTMPTITPKGLYISGNGSAMKPQLQQCVVDQALVPHQDHEPVHADDQVELHRGEDQNHVEVGATRARLLRHEVGEGVAEQQGAHGRDEGEDDRAHERAPVEGALEEAGEGLQGQVAPTKGDDANLGGVERDRQKHHDRRGEKEEKEERRRQDEKDRPIGPEIDSPGFRYECSGFARPSPPSPILVRARREAAPPPVHAPFASRDTS